MTGVEEGFLREEVAREQGLQELSKHCTVGHPEGSRWRPQDC